MRKPIYIAKDVKDAIRGHIESAVDDAVDGYLSANEDEDTMTGHLGACLKIKTQIVHVVQDEIPGDWKWSIDYYKFRGRGQKATETYLGADGIFELSLQRTGRIDTKTVLFQAKMDWQSRGDVLDQSVRLSTWREAAFILNFTPNSFDTFTIDQVLRARGLRKNAGDPMPLRELLGTAFLNCDIGDADLQYDARARRLVWRTASGEVVATKFTTKNRIRLNVIPPVPGRRGLNGIDKEIPNELVHNFRMDSTIQDMLSLGYDSSPKDIKAAKRAISLAYHPDQFSMLDELEKAILNRRMQEFNRELDEVAARSKQRR